MNNYCSSRLTIIACLQPPQEVPLRCEDIKTVDDKYQYPPFDEICDFEGFDDNQVRSNCLKPWSTLFILAFF